MARPRVFIRHVREDLERFIRELGYEPVRDEVVANQYDEQDDLETSEYRDVDLCAALGSIVGGRNGSDAQDDPGHSIAEVRLRVRASRKQVPS